jgi:hypothetical protein
MMGGDITVASDGTRVTVPRYYCLPLDCRPVTD